MVVFTDVVEKDERAMSVECWWCYTEVLFTGVVKKKYE